MLNCRDIAQHASDHLDKKLTLRESLGYRFHLFMCAYCRQFVRHLRSTIELSHQLGEHDLLTQDEAKKITDTTLTLVAKHTKQESSCSGQPVQPL